MKSDRLVALSKLMSLMLRHEPTRFGLALDAEGFVPLVEVLAAVRGPMPGSTQEDIVAVVETVERDKQRFSIVDDEIRANYGHSFAERIAQTAAVPPPVLLHGTYVDALAAILREGLRPMKRQYVHLTPSVEMAMRVGARRGKALLLAVDADAAHAAGVVFYRANENFWLVDALPAKFVRTHEAHTRGSSS